MYCARCGSPLAPNTAFCSSCGAPVPGVAGGPSVLKRPGLITLLAVLQLVGAAIWLLTALAAVTTDIAGVSQEQREVANIAVAVLLGSLGLVQVFCGVGLWKLRPYGRTIQLTFAWIGLIGIPFGTIVSILILVYLYKPGIKALFSGKPISELSADERTSIAEVSQSSWALVVVVIAIVVLLVVAIGGIVAAIAVPGLMRARTAGNEAAAIAALRAINSGEASYSSSCSAGGYAVSLDDLAKPPRGNALGFISPDLGTNGVTKGGYTVTLTKDAAAGVTDVGTAASTCNASTKPPASSYFASAEPVTPGGTGTRHFATDARGTIFSSASPIANPIMASASVVPVQ